MSLVSIVWQQNTLLLLDQRVLPEQEIWMTLTTAPQCAQAITDMVVRGAPAIGIAASYAVVLSALQHQNLPTIEQQITQIQQDIEVLRQSRPTAVNLFWALERMSAQLATHSTDLASSLLHEANRIMADDLAMNKAMAKWGADYICQQYIGQQEPISKSIKVLTHCNTGALATAGHGTALGVIRDLAKTGRLQQVFADETRPWHQGSRLTVWELQQENIPVTLNVEGAAALIMQQQQIDWVIVGADRITANGDTANKIGTFNLAVLAKHFGVKFMVVAPSTTVDMALASGDLIEIEQRGKQELVQIGAKQLAPIDCQVFNPVFDVTPAELIDALVTEHGVIEQPNREKMRHVFA